MVGRVRSRSSVRAVTAPDAVEWVPDGTRRTRRIAFDRAQADQILADSLTDPHLEATGRCWTCGKRVSGERRYCGPCAAGRDTSPTKRGASLDS